MQNTIHPAEVTLFYLLRHTEVARFSQLLRESELETDTFKFHLRKLMMLGYIQKSPEGEYRLSAVGKEFANTIDDQEQKVQKQPKLSVMLVVERSNEAGEPQFLLHQRKRNPYFGFWGHMSGPVLWGEDPERTAARELQKQTGLQADFTIHAFYQQRDHRDNSLVEDKLFIILRAQNIRGQLRNSWPGGISKWMTLAELQDCENYFELTAETTALPKGNYATRELHYTLAQY